MGEERIPVEEWEVIIVGGGPAGITAGIYSSRNLHRTLLLEKGILGGQLNLAPYIENYPSYPDGIPGWELARKMGEQLQKTEVEVRREEVKEILKEKEFFKVRTEKAEYHTLSVIIATGGYPKKLGVEGEERLIGKGVSYCGVCDAPLFRDKKIVVVGGGDTALTESLHLAQFAREVILIHRRENFRGAKAFQKKVLSHPKIKPILKSHLQEIMGDKRVEGVKINQGGKTEFLPCEGVFIFVGFSPSSAFLGNLVEKDEEGYIITDEKMETKVKGIFACGDVRKKRDRQVIVACGEGAVSAQSAHEFLEKKND